MQRSEESRSRGRGRPRANPRREGDADPREGIVAAASDLFAAHGVDEVTMAQIAQRAGLQQSSIYYWFGSKSAVLASILERVNRVPLAIVERERRATGPVACRLYRLVREDVLAICGFPFDINEIHRLAIRHPDEFSAYWEERDRLDDEVEALLADGVRRGELRTVDTHLAARALLAGDEATQNWLRSDPRGDYSPADVADHQAEVTLRALLADPAAFPAVREGAIAGSDA